jgi:N-acetylneuraminate synthase
MAKFRIGDRPIGPDESTFVIAEAGSNHNGDLDLAKELVNRAAESGADAVKFQTFRAKDLYVEKSGPAEYLDEDRSLYDIIADNEMPYDWIPELKSHCDERDILFMSTPFDAYSADHLQEYVPAYKVASYTMSHHPFLRHLANSDHPIILSTGAHEMEEIRESVQVLRDAGCEDLVLLQCVASYPTPIESGNVLVVKRLQEEFDLPAGLSDHTLDPTVAPTTAVALGGAVVEKHFTLDKSMEGPDHQFALEPDELADMVSSIRDTEKVLGTGDKTVLDEESELHQKARRYVHTVREVSAGEQLTEDNIAVLRSGNQANGLHPKFYDELVGRVATTDIPKNAGLTWDDVNDA